MAESWRCHEGELSRQGVLYRAVMQQRRDSGRDYSKGQETVSVQDVCDTCKVSSSLVRVVCAVFVVVLST